MHVHAYGVTMWQSFSHDSEQDGCSQLKLKLKLQVNSRSTCFLAAGTGTVTGTVNDTTHKPTFVNDCPMLVQLWPSP